MAERTGPTTWAQDEWFADLGPSEDNCSSSATNSFADLSGHRLPVAVVRRAVADVVARHEGLRTLITRDIDGRRMQTVCIDHDIDDAIRVVPEGPAADAAIEAARATAFRLGRQWPVVVVLATDGDAVVRISVVVDHVATDAWGWKVLGADIDAALRERSAGRAPFAGAPAAEQPVDTAAWEAGPDGRRHLDRAGRFWEHQVGTLAAALDGWSPAAAPAPGPPMLHAFRLASRATADAAETLAAGGVRPSTLYPAAFTAAIAAVEGTGTVGVQFLTANRLTPGQQASVRKAVMPAPVVVATDAPFPDRLAAIAAQQLDGARFANMPPAAVAALRDGLLGARAGSGAAGARFNFIDNSVIPADVNETSLGGEHIRFTDPAIQGRVTADPPRPGGSRYILSVQHQPRGALLTLATHADTAWCPAGPAMLRHIEALMVWAAAGARGAAPAFPTDR